MLAPVVTNLTIAVIATILAGYLIGSIPIADMVARRRGIPDLRMVGDRNPGYWNTLQLLGRRAALPVFVGDVAKGAAGAGLGALVGDRWWMPWVGAGAAMVGHAWPVFAGFRGGRSVLTFVGGACVAAPLAAVIAVGLTGISWMTTRRFDWAARIGIVSFPVIQIVVDGPERTALTGALMTFVGLRFAQAMRS